MENKNLELDVNESLSDVRSDYVPGQIRNASEIRPGKTYQLFFNGKLKGEFKALSCPYSIEEMSGLIYVEYEVENEKIKLPLSLADVGVISYESGQWNRVQYLIDPEKVEKDENNVISLDEWKKRNGR